MAPWMHNFFTWSVGHAAELGFAGATELRDWLARFEIGLMTDWQHDPNHGYCWLEASAYTLVVTDPSGKTYLPSYSAMYQTTFPTLAGLECNSPAMVAAMGELEKQKWKAGQMRGYAYSATGYPANLQIGLAAAADSAVPNAHDAWNLFESRSIKPQGTTAYNNYPNFAVVPRSASYTPDPSPPSSPVPAPNPPPPPATPPVTPPGPTTPLLPIKNWRQPGAQVQSALNVLDGVFSYLEVLPVRLPYALVVAIRPRASHITPTSQTPPVPVTFAQRAPVATSTLRAKSRSTDRAVPDVDCHDCVVVIPRGTDVLALSAQCAANEPVRYQTDSLIRENACRQTQRRR